jgi:hypothetical protein
MVTLFGRYRVQMLHDTGDHLSTSTRFPGEIQHEVRICPIPDYGFQYNPSCLCYLPGEVLHPMPYPAEQVSCQDLR